MVGAGRLKERPHVEEEEAGTGEKESILNF
jgi:hypothetical protein